MVWLLILVFYNYILIIKEKIFFKIIRMIKYKYFFLNFIVEIWDMFYEISEICIL